MWPNFFCHLLKWTLLLLLSHTDSFRWVKDGKQFGEVLLESGTLTPHLTTDLHFYQGTYRCYAANELGTAVSNLVHLTTEREFFVCHDHRVWVTLHLSYCVWNNIVLLIIVTVLTAHIMLYCAFNATLFTEDVDNLLDQVKVARVTVSILPSQQRPGHTFFWMAIYFHS